MKKLITLHHFGKFFQKVNPRIFIRKPFFIVRAILKTIKVKLLNGDPLIGANFATHYSCNLKCKHCYEAPFRKKKSPSMSLNEQKEAIRKLIDFGVLNITFIGGEVTIDPHLPELIKACKPHKTMISLATNSFKLSKKDLAYYKKIGVDKICTSLDSWDKKDHDSNRGIDGSYQAVMNTIDNCKEVGLDISVQIVVYKSFTSTEHFQKVVDYAKLKNFRLQFKPAIPVGEWQGKDDILIGKDDIEQMNKLQKKSPNYVRDSDSGCPAFQRVITISAYGDVMPCNAIHISFGNIINESLSEILKRGRSIEYFNDKYPGCPPAEDNIFIKNILSITYDSKEYPVNYTSIKNK